MKDTIYFPLNLFGPPLCCGPVPRLLPPPPLPLNPKQKKNLPKFYKELILK